MTDQTLFRIRRARLEDAGGIARVWVRAWQVAYRGLVPDEVLDGMDVGASRARWRDVDDGTGLAVIRLRAEL